VRGPLPAVFGTGLLHEVRSSGGAPADVTLDGRIVTVEPHRVNTTPTGAVVEGRGRLLGPDCVRWPAPARRARPIRLI
jgi:hypothetical protein